VLKRKASGENNENGHAPAFRLAAGTRSFNADLSLQINVKLNHNPFSHQITIMAIEEGAQMKATTKKFATRKSIFGGDVLSQPLLPRNRCQLRCIGKSAFEFKMQKKKKVTSLCRRDE
jgi:hypothetical protein